MALVISIQATIRIEQSNRAPIFIEQPPVSSPPFKTGVPASIPFGKVQDPDGDAMTLTLIPEVPGCSLTLEGEQITLNWDGTGAPGEHTVTIKADDGKAE